jgi:hypothetical protein
VADRRDVADATLFELESTLWVSLEMVHHGRNAYKITDRIDVLPLPGVRRVRHPARQLSVSMVTNQMHPLEGPVRLCVGC